MSQGVRGRAPRRVKKVVRDPVVAAVDGPTAAGAPAEPSDGDASGEASGDEGADTAGPAAKKRRRRRRKPAGAGTSAASDSADSGGDQPE